MAQRVGHPSNKNLNFFLNFLMTNCINCVIYKLTKQTRLPFPLSINKSKASFDLIYFNV